MVMTVLVGIATAAVATLAIYNRAAASNAPALNANLSQFRKGANVFIGFFSIFATIISALQGISVMRNALAGTPGRVGLGRDLSDY